MTLVISFGRYSGFYFYGRSVKRLNLGWLTLTFMPRGFDQLLYRVESDFELEDLLQELLGHISNEEFEVTDPEIVEKIAGLLESDRKDLAQIAAINLLTSCSELCGEKLLKARIKQGGLPQQRLVEGIAGLFRVEGLNSRA